MTILTTILIIYGIAYILSGVVIMYSLRAHDKLKSWSLPVLIILWLPVVLTLHTYLLFTANEED